MTQTNRGCSKAPRSSEYKRLRQKSLLTVNGLPISFLFASRTPVKGEKFEKEGFENPSSLLKGTAIGKEKVEWKDFIVAPN